MGATKEGREPRINRSLISIKIVTFFVITGLTALHILHSTKPLLLGLNFEEYRYISILAPFISILGPIVVGPLADRFAAKNANNYGKILRILTAVVLIITSIIYACLFAVPDVHREEARRPSVSFGCDQNGAVVFQERCSQESTCHHWKAKVGTVNLTNCSYTCQNPTQFESLYTPWLEGTQVPSTEEMSESEYDHDYDENTVTESQRSKRHLKKSTSSEIEVMSGEEGSPSTRVERDAVPKKIYVEPPHLCLTEKSETGETIVKQCHVYTDDTKNIVVHSVLRSATNIENDTHSADWCNYPLDGFQCNVPEIQAKWMIQLKNSTRCKPMIECEVINPYDSRESVLADSQCINTTGDLDATLSGYFVIRILGDVFALAALTLLNTAIVIAVRETSEGRGEVSRQYAWGAIGFVLLFPALDVVFFNNETQHTANLVALIVLIVCFVLAAIVLLVSSNMPLSPPEWWWHTKTGMLVYPMSAIRRYSPEIIALTLISLLFGTFWSSIHSYLRWTFSDELAITSIGLFFVLVLLFNVDKFIEYCGHSNIFIAAFAVFIIRFTALGCDYEWLTVLMETLEPLVMTVVWITIIIYMRHAMPRKLTATGQALAVIAFFGIGKGFGALIGLARDERAPSSASSDIFQWLTIAASIVAVVYFVIYNLILAPRFSAKPQPSDVLSPSASQTLNGAATNGNANGNGNGSYSPLRVYHNERGKKGQFRF
ncbi:uncharacterized protein LOC129944241 [Eupeodes corollae]|uniref:uncharacterized protein LOC129944241 n=1 Tax=Eupeodes corollae TaxID=290404 RepID=UPI002491186B|nr:uncharacterized protein LOC129944241 [Eupeodes corollae]XP_055909527.1 uncharacterized protein LOC129944241 [Eupeodes corollae]XP_055909528.1 uncharacterized protein LOC129944241 [Eupeodes corollae]